MSFVRARTVFAFIALAPLGAVVAALFTQHALDMQPCPWCVFQRLIFLIIAVWGLLGLLWSGGFGRRLAGTLALLTALGGMSAALWHYFVAASSVSCNQTLADRVVSGWFGLDALLPAVFEARASCADAAAKLLGVPYPLWSLALFTLLALASVVVLRLRR
jgi:disulfide bond formation protein DsbB